MLSQYLLQFKAVYDGQPWYGDNLMLVLGDVTPAQSMVRPQPEVHSLAELVAHVIYWRQSLIKRLQGDKTYKPSMASDENWPSLDSLKKTGWAILLNTLADSQHELVSLLSRKNEAILTEPYRTGTNVQQLIEGVLQHDIYHQGQMALVKKMVRQS